MKCNRCGISGAILVRRYSGESLCRECLLNSLFTRLRRSIGRYNLLEEQDRILFASICSEADLPALQMMVELEEKYPRSSMAVVGVSESIFLAKRFYLDFFPLHPPRVSSKWRAMALLAREASRSAKANGFSKVLMPLTLDDSVALFLHNAKIGTPLAEVIDGQLVLGGNSQPPIPLTAPFFEIPIDELLLAHDAKWKPSDPVLRLVLELESRFPGTRFNILRSYHRLFRASSSQGGKH